MIKSLTINNYALIEQLEMTPSSRLNIITGETGAGKSIMLGAVGLLLGNRADTKALFSDESKCTVEGVFDVSSYNLKQLFQDEDLDYENECIIRREISSTGKSRAFVNDTPVTLDILKKIGVHLMDIHSQHETLHLGDNSYQLEILDTFSGHGTLLNEYRSVYRIYESAQRKYNHLIDRSKKETKDTDYKQFLFDELESANLKGERLEYLEEQLSILENAEDIKNNLSQLTMLLDEAETSIINQLKEAIPIISSMKSFGVQFQELADRIHSASAELDDISMEISREQDKVELDPERLALISERVDLINRLLQKHQVKTLDELLIIHANLDQELASINNIDEELAKAKKELQIQKVATLAAGKKLTESRKSNALPFASAIEKLIQQLGIENGTVTFNITPEEPTENGLDLVEMLFSANKGIPPKELKSVASGGEFSRLIFAIKYLLADKSALPTIIFDEIDTGVSGEIALKMVEMMKTMSQNHQVISISHLPQFAAGGDAHYYVYKDHSSSKSVSKMKQLESKEDRVLAIAQMIGGDNPGEGAIASAKDLLAKK
ncbi:MAG: DNA repair protein RecN [Cyclobacteriaceae bacterium]